MIPRGRYYTFIWVGIVNLRILSTSKWLLYFICWDLTLRILVLWAVDNWTVILWVTGGQLVSFDLFWDNNSFFRVCHLLYRLIPTICCVLESQFFRKFDILKAKVRNVLKYFISHTCDQMLQFFAIEKVRKYSLDYI